MPMRPGHAIKMAVKAAAGIAAVSAILIGPAPAQTTDYTYRPKSVFGSSDIRVKADSRVYPWTAVGRFNRAGQGHCTATVVARRIVATAAHCLVSRGGGYMAPDTLHFVAGWDRGEYLFHSVATELHPSPGHRPDAAPTLRVVAEDWALIVLAEDPVPVTGILRPFVYTAEAAARLRKADTVFTQAGYSGDRGQVLTAHPDCAVLGLMKGLKVVEHFCQAVPGDSGSPVVFAAPDGNGYMLAAVHSAHAKDRVGGSGYAVPAASFIDALRALEKKLGG